MMEHEIKGALSKRGEHYDPSKLVVVGCGSISRVYRHDKYALKVKIPGIERAMYCNYCWFLPFVAVVDTFTGYRHHLWKRLETFMDSITTQYNFPREVYAMQTFQEDLATHGFSEHVRTPRVFTDMCSENVIAMEFVEGTILTEHRQKQGRLAPEQAMQLLRLTISNLMLFRASHLDLHGGNILVDDKGKLIILDFGMSLTTKSTNPKDLVAITLLLEATFSENMERLVRILASRTTYLDPQLTGPLASDPKLTQDLLFHLVRTYHRAHDLPLFTDRLTRVYRGVDEWLSKTPHVYTNECIALYEICACHAVTLIATDPDGLNADHPAFVDFLRRVCDQQGCVL
jgi:predicted unusual protein kinase regulating ubiquinone biosynthesis (AarF/ABC1/UbiB family)